MQNAKVLSTDFRSVQGKVEQDESKKKGKAGAKKVPTNVTLLVLADDAARIQLARQSGRLSLTLRGDSPEGKGVNPNPITWDDLIGNKSDDDNKDDSEGTVKMGGITYKVIKGELVPQDGN